MTDDRMDVLIRRLDVGAEPDPAFVAASLTTLLGAADRARRADRRPLAWLQRGLVTWAAALRAPVADAGRPLRLIALVALLVALLAGILAVGASRRAPLGGPSGLVVITDHGRFEGIDIETGTSVDLLPGLPSVKAVSRSPDGWLASYRSGDDLNAQHLWVIRTDGRDAHVVAPEVAFSGVGCNDIWSNDSRWLVAGVEVNGVGRILVVDTLTGEHRFVTPEGMDAGCPTWSPDGAWIAYTHHDPAGDSIEVVRRDGTDREEVTHDPAGGPVSWSRDGWIYYDGGDKGHVYRARVGGGSGQQLSPDSLSPAYAPALSPDGRQLSYTVFQGSGRYDVYVANPDGSNPRPALKNAITLGWSTDGRYLLAVWVAPPGSKTPGGLVIAHPDGTGIQVLRPFDNGACPPALENSCFADVGWGQSRP